MAVRPRSNRSPTPCICPSTCRTSSRRAASRKRHGWSACYRRSWISRRDTPTRTVFTRFITPLDAEDRPGRWRLFSASGNAPPARSLPAPFQSYLVNSGGLDLCLTQSIAVIGVYLRISPGLAPGFSFEWPVLNLRVGNRVDRRARTPIVPQPRARTCPNFTLSQPFVSMVYGPNYKRCSNGWRSIPIRSHFSGVTACSSLAPSRFQRHPVSETVVSVAPKGVASLNLPVAFRPLHRHAVQLSSTPPKGGTIHPFACCRFLN
jgi:hypothetical protein